MVYVLLYNRRKKKHTEEKSHLQETYANELLKAQMEVKEQTLKTVAYDLHDNIGQLLSLTAITLSAINPDDKAKTTEKIALVEDLTKRSIREVKALSKLLDGEALMSKGLAAAIEAELQWLQRLDNCEVSFDREGYQPISMGANKETIVFRLFQEIVNNIIQHAQATAIAISLKQTDDDLELSIRDNGIGFNTEQALALKSGMGLNNIQKRTALIGGTAIIKSAPGLGTVITIVVPYQ